MTRVALNFRTSRGRRFDPREYEAEVRAAFGRVKRDIKAEFDDVVSDWNHAPEFRAGFVELSADAVAVRVDATGPHRKIWQYVDKGTRPHIIRPRRGGKLRFATGYSARTQPGRAHTGSGTASGPVVYTNAVMHPGNAARGFTQDILARYQNEFFAEIREAIKDAGQ